MINSKAALKEYMEADKRQLGITRKYPRPFSDEIWKYEIILRKYEYWYNKNSIASRFIMAFYKFKWHSLSVKLGISIGPNVCGKGLSIAHSNAININDSAKVGENCRIHEGVTIGASGGAAPIIGNNCFLASGCKVIGNVIIADRCVVGANAVVVDNILESAITVAGVPAKKISSNNSDKFIYWYKKGKCNDT